MKIFISWSGDTSHQVATILRDWLPTVLQSVDPWVSSDDIAKGGRWSGAIAKQLADSQYGIVCLDPSNVGSPWLNFEAGALSTLFEAGRVAPFLLGLLPSDVLGPLSQFQMTTVSEKEVLRLVESVNQAMSSDAVSVKRLRKTYAYCWQGLRDALRQIDVPLSQSGPPREENLARSTSTSPDEISTEDLEVLTALAEQVESQEEPLIPANALARDLAVSPNKLHYMLLILESNRLIRLDDDGDPWLEDEGIRYLGERDLL